ncbi:MAG: phosphoribosylglycinamide formyltransferase [Oscillospiraceae bacterium]|nr:phosphoribosylglycinamide formyltransferase [Oscillospiraceae bacterium]
MMRVAVLVSGGGSNLQAILDAKARGELPQTELCLVLSSAHGAYALERAEKAGVPSEVCSPKDYADRSAYTDAILEILQKHRIEAVVLAGFMFMLSPQFAEKYENRALNVHPALIPSFCGPGYYGLKVHEYALAAGVKVSGATVHFVTAETDAGPIIAQKAVEILEDDTPEVLQRRIMEQCEWILLPRALALLSEGKITVENGRVHIDN